MNDTQIKNLAKKVATANLAAGSVSSTLVNPTIDSEGRDALRITIVVTANSTSSIQGADVLNTYAQIRSELANQGEERFPVIEFATPDEVSVD